MSAIDDTIGGALNANQHDRLLGSLTPPTMSCGSRSRWAVAETHPQAEQWALLNLERQGYQAYLPLVTVLKRDRSTRTMTRQATIPLFSNYLFVQPGTHWGPIAHTRGIAKLLLSDGKPHWLKDGVVSALQAAVALGRTKPPQHTTMAPGTAVSVTDGAFKGHDGIVVATRRRTATVLLLVFGALREVIVPAEQLAQRA